MTEIEPSDTPPAVGQVVPAAVPEVIPRSGVTFEEVFLRFLVVVAGLALGAVLAFLIGLFTGLVPITC